MYIDIDPCWLLEPSDSNQFDSIRLYWSDIGTMWKTSVLLWLLPIICGLHRKPHLCRFLKILKWIFYATAETWWPEWQVVEPRENKSQIQLSKSCAKNNFRWPTRTEYSWKTCRPSGTSDSMLLHPSQVLTGYLSELKHSLMYTACHCMKVSSANLNLKGKRKKNALFIFFGRKIDKSFPS